MGAAYFYHLTRSPPEETLPMLLTKARAAGWSVQVRALSDQRLKWLSDRLWSSPEDGFVAHGLAGGDFDARQPILFSLDSANRNAAACIMAVDGAVVSVDEVREMERVCILFDGNEPAALETARAQWKSLTDAGCSAQYWSQESGSWEKKAEA